MTKAIAERFYFVHRERPFYNDLTNFMSSGPCIVMCLEKEDAIKGWRALMGATNPEAAEANTLRKLYGKNIDNNAVHGSDAPETAAEEVHFSSLAMINVIFIHYFIYCPLYKNKAGFLLYSA